MSKIFDGVPPQQLAALDQTRAQIRESIKTFPQEAWREMLAAGCVSQLCCKLASLSQGISA